MPELPEVETSRRGIAPHILNQKIKNIIIRNNQLRWPIPKHLSANATGQNIRQVSRRGKYLLLRLDSGTIIIHLGMSGSLRICTTDTAPQKHDHIDFIFDNNKLLRLRDPRRFGAVLWTGRPVEQHKLLKSLGPEPLENEFNGDYLYKASRKRTCSIKSLIMNSNIVVGIGNIYACESLFHAGIKPKRKAGTISRKRCAKLAQTIRATLANAIKFGGTTLRDFTRENGKPGYFTSRLLVYGRENNPCPNCGMMIKKIVQQNRSTFYCASCQK